MAVFRIEKIRDYTVMSNHHLRNAGLSLKSKGLLSMMLSLPEDWNYTTRGLAKICKEGTDSIGSALKELERAGYIVRNRLRDSKGKIVDVEYVIYETPHPPDTGQPCEDEPDTACPDTENPDMDNPCLENRPQLNKEKRNPEEQNTHSPSTEGSNPIQSSPQTPAGGNRAGRDWMRERESYRELILENIEYDILVQNERMDRDGLDELVKLILDEDRKINAQKFESAFYANPDLRSVRPPEEPKESAPATLDLEALVEQLRKSPELANTLAALLVSAPSEK